MLPALFTLLLLTQPGTGDSLAPAERVVKIADLSSPFHHIRVRVLPVRVYKVKARGGEVDAITAKCLDPETGVDRYPIVAADLLLKEDREWFEGEVQKLWKRNPTVEFLLSEHARKQIKDKQR